MAHTGDFEVHPIGTGERLKVLETALADFERSAALIANTASEIAPPEIAKQGAQAWVRCLTNARALLRGAA
jgi:hypothetical protein